MGEIVIAATSPPGREKEYERETGLQPKSETSSLSFSFITRCLGTLFDPEQWMRWQVQDSRERGKVSRKEAVGHFAGQSDFHLRTRST